MDVNVSEIIRLARDAGQAASAAPTRASVVVRKSAADVESQAKVRAAVDTGYLRGSIGSDVTRDGAAVYADTGPTADYGPYVEFGTRNQSPQPYMMPAADAVTLSFIAAAEQVVKL